MEQEIRRRLEGKRYREAFELLLPEYQHKVFRLACAMLGNQALAEEAAQEVFMRVWKALAGYRGEASLSTWIYRIARNTCLTALRAVASKRTLSLEEPEVRLAAERRTETQQGPALDLPHLLSQLPEHYRQVLTLFHLEQRSYQEVACMLDLPMGTVKSHIHRARKQLAAAVTSCMMTGGTR